MRFLTLGTAALLAHIASVVSAEPDTPAYVGTWAYEDGPCWDSLTIGEQFVDDGIDLYCTWEEPESEDGRTFTIEADCGAEPSIGKTATTFTFILSEDGSILTWEDGPSFGGSTVSTWSRCE